MDVAACAADVNETITESASGRRRLIDIPDSSQI